MKGFLTKWFINIAALMIVVHAIGGISVDKWQTTIWAAMLLGFINAFLRPVIVILTLPINILSLGLFTFIINGFMFYLVSKLIAGFQVIDFWSAFWGALLFSIISFLLNLIINTDKKVHFRFYRYGWPRQKRYRDVIDVDAEIKDEGQK